jgi:hypothetical protein
MQGIWYKYKPDQGYMSSRAAYKPRIRKDKEDNSIELFQVLQGKKNTRVIPNSSRGYGNPREELLLA